MKHCPPFLPFLPLTPNFALTHPALPSHLTPRIPDHSPGHGVVQPIKMQTSANKVELGVLHVLEADPGHADQGAMCDRNPLHTFMFNSKGHLLNANRAAFEAFQSSPPGEHSCNCTCCIIMTVINSIQRSDSCGCRESLAMPFLSSCACMS